MLGHWADCEATARAAIEPADENPTAQAYALWILGLALTSRSRADAQRTLEQALELAESVHNRWQHNIILSSIATLVASGEDPQRALATLTRSVDELWRAGYRTVGWNVCSQTVPVLAELGRLRTPPSFSAPTAATTQAAWPTSPVSSTKPRPGCAASSNRRNSKGSSIKALR